MFVDIATYQPLGGHSYFPLPEYLHAKKAIVNVKNQDNQCLKWALLSALHPAERDADRVSKYAPYAQELDFTGVEFPATLADVAKVCVLIGCVVMASCALHCLFAQLSLLVSGELWYSSMFPFTS